MTPMRSLAAALAATTCLGLAVAGSAEAAVTLSWAKIKPIALIGGASNGTLHVSDRVAWLPCPGKATTVMTGWTGPKAPVAMVYSHLVNQSRQMGLAVRRPAQAGRFRAQGLCLRGARVTAKERLGGAVSCGRRQIALGVPIDGGPYWSEPVAAKPVGARGWINTGQGNYARSKAICVPAGALRKVTRVARTAPFAVGRSTATVSATCPGGRRPVSWGFEAGVLSENALRSSSATMTVPLLYASLPKGKSGWKLTFATPDGAPARTSAPLTVHVTCALPG